VTPAKETIVTLGSPFRTVVRSTFETEEEQVLTSATHEEEYPLDFLSEDELE
jgi:hypothetical protein